MAGFAMPAKSEAKQADKPKVSFAFKPAKSVKKPLHKRQRSQSPELITGFDASAGAIPVAAKEEKKEIVIPAVQNRNWIEESLKRRGLYRPVGNVIDAEMAQEADELERRSRVERTYGLTVRKTEAKQDGLDKRKEVEQVKVEAVEEVKVEHETQDEKAIKAIISEFADKDKKSDLVLPLASASSSFTPLSEEDAYKLDVQTRPDEPTLDDYEAVPIDQFGFALLRGMGWKEGEGIGKNRKRVDK